MWSQSPRAGLTSHTGYARGTQEVGEMTPLEFAITFIVGTICGIPLGVTLLLCWGLCASAALSDQWREDNLGERRS